MAEVSIDIDAMRTFIRDLENAKLTGSGAAQDLKNKAGEAGAYEAGLDAWTGGLTYWELDSLIIWCRRAVALAEQVAAAMPSFSTGTAITFDESLVPTTTMDQVRGSVSALIDALGGSDGLSDEERDALLFGGDVPQHILDILAANQGDPYFAAELAGRLSPEQLAGFLSAMDEIRRRKTESISLGGEGSEPNLAGLDECYRDVLDLFGQTLGLASRGVGTLAVPGMAETWSQYIQNESTPPRDVNLLSMAFSRGQWSYQFLDSIADAVTTRQGNQGIAYWSHDQGPGLEVVDPAATSEDGSGKPLDPHYQVTNPWINLFQAGRQTPSAIKEWFTGTGRVTITLPDGTTTTVNRQLWDIMHDTALDDQTFDALLAAIGEAATAPEGETRQAWQAMAAGDLTDVFLGLQAEVEQYKRDHPLAPTVGHTVLDFLGLFFDPVDIANSLWYAPEGNWGDAAWGLTTIIPITGFLSGLRRFEKSLENVKDPAERAEALQAWRKAWADKIDLTEASTRDTVSVQKQARHIFRTPEYKGRTKEGFEPVSYFTSIDDAQAVLDAFKSGDAKVLGFKGNGDTVVRVDSVTGSYVNGELTADTHIFFIKGTKSPSVVPYQPGYKE
ncbi:MAG: hypothetical protein LBV00_08905 [Propionibacteriaceae bacterium]|jgi:hypothetical protein|nr:hypothetical protein [Propionibacteriaceae bacterium]